MKDIKSILQEQAVGSTLTVKGWVRTKRDTKNAIFLELNDGSCFGNLQCVFDVSNLSDQNKAALERLGTGASAAVTGTLVASPAAGQPVEVSAQSAEVIGEAPVDTYPLQKKAHSLEFLREIAHLRPRTNTFGAVARVRNQMSYAVHSFFQERGFNYVHTPIITASDCEGAGEMFQVTTLDMDAIAKAGKAVDYSKDFFGKPSFLSVSGQLNVETYCMALSKVYTFGPTFRAENSNTTRHLAEFWMIEPEFAFAELEDNMALAEDFLKYLLGWALDKCADDLDFFDKRIQKGLISMLDSVRNSKFVHMTYTDAIKQLEANKDTFEFKPYWGCDLQTEHERFLSETVVKGPLIVTDYPKEIKAFYMRLNEDGKTVRAMDVLVPRIGEIIGGSEREYRHDVLLNRIRELGLDEAAYWWYLDLRRFGTAPHSGFGLGFERLMRYVTGMENIRDVIPFPRAVKQAEF
ncbi:MAG: asparagine--tRNA ligase [Spirochaetes bacterium]|nr:asparagine--tRNA ligase [Spirochaetota bacterium]MBU0953939.1 asparagine--tRNA ligase [Spirochaetota bacterium]